MPAHSSKAKMMQRQKTWCNLSVWSLKDHFFSCVLVLRFCGIIRQIRLFGRKPKDVVVRIQRMQLRLRHLPFPDRDSGCVLLGCSMLVPSDSSLHVCSLSLEKLRWKKSDLATPLLSYVYYISFQSQFLVCATCKNCNKKRK